MNHRILDAWRWLLLLVEILPFVPATARADGGMPLVLKLIPPYEITVYASSAPLLAGMTVDVSVLINRDPLGAIITDAQVELNATPVGRTEPVLTFPATHALATNKAFYAANVRLSAGRWQFVADLKDGDWTGQVPFQLEITQPVHHSRFPLRTIAVWLAAGLVLLGAALVAIRAGHHEPAPSRKRE